ncbi:MAG: DUF6569 family protein [bacterium]
MIPRSRTAYAAARRSTLTGLVASFLDGFTLKKAISFKGLHVFPVCLIGSAAGGEKEIMSLDEGLGSGRAAVMETGEMDRVTIRNAGHAPVLIMDGETVLGGAQNRIMNTTTVVQPGERAELPASCAEVNRWEAKPGVDLPAKCRNFTRSDMVFAGLRHQRMEEMIRSIRDGNRAAVDQNQVWRTIVQRFGVSGAKTRTLDLHDLYDFWFSALKVYSDRFHLVGGQAGMISFLDRRTWFADIFSSRDMLMKQYKKVIKGLAFDALIRLEMGVQLTASQTPGIDAARAALRAIKVSREEKTPDGGNRYFESPVCIGFAAVAAGEVIYLTACSREFRLF